MLTWTRRVGARPKRKFDNDPEAVNFLLSTFLPPFFVLAVLNYLLFFWFSSSLGARVKSQVEAFLSCTDFFDSIWPTFFNTISCELNESQNLNHSRSHTHTQTDASAGVKSSQANSIQENHGRDDYIHIIIHSPAVLCICILSLMYSCPGILWKKKKKRNFLTDFIPGHTRRTFVCVKVDGWKFHFGWDIFMNAFRNMKNDFQSSSSTNNVISSGLGRGWMKCWAENQDEMKTGRRDGGNVSIRTILYWRREKINDDDELSISIL
jgi:hypothetical protein